MTYGQLIIHSDLMAWLFSMHNKWGGVDMVNCHSELVLPCIILITSVVRSALRT